MPWILGKPIFLLHNLVYMSTTPSIQHQLQAGYAFSPESSILLGTALHEGEALPQVTVRVPLAMLNRHGLIAGATGTGKTKTLQRLAESLSEQGIGVLMMDIKGDVSGISQPGLAHPKVQERVQQMGIGWAPKAFPVEFLSLSGSSGIPLRATVSEFGPVLFSRMLGVNDTQAGVLAIVFKYCDDRQLPLVDLKDLKKVLQHLTNEGKQEIEADYGRIAPATSSAILRKVVELEAQGAEHFFGEPSFEVEDLCRIGEDGRGIINVVRLNDMQDRPKLFATFLLQLLAEVYATFPEVGDADRPKLVLIFDEAHLMFKEASDALLSQLETIMKLVRSKGVGVFFCTQLPTDVPASILSQLGLKVQHALRAFTAADRKAIKLAAENYPESEFYKTDELLTALGTGEALVTALNERGVPTPLVHTLLAPPQSRMDVISAQELEANLSRSNLREKYAQPFDRESAYERLSQKLRTEEEAPPPPKTTSFKPAPSLVEQVTSNPITKVLVKEIARGLLGALGLGGKRRGRGGWL